MRGLIRKTIDFVDDFVGLLEREKEAESDRVRTRLFAIACITFFGMAVFNFFGLLWAYGGLSMQHVFTGGVAFVAALFLILLRITRNVKMLSWMYGIGSLVGIWIASYIDHYGHAESFEIGAAYTPYMIAGIVFVALTGTRAATFFFSIMCIVSLVFFFQVGTLLHYSDGIAPQSRAGLVLRVASVILTMTIIIPASKVIYGTLEDLKQSVDRANRAEATRKELLATMSHEIRTPLNGLISVSELLEKHNHDDTTKTHLNIISLSANNLLDIVNTTLSQARSEHIGHEDVSDISIANDPVDLAELLEQSCDLFTAHAQQKNLWIGTHDLESLPVSILGDAPHLRQVINNLVGNAIKFTHEGGVRLGARQVHETHDTAEIQFFVQDTGVGIEPEAMKRVFKRFGQSASARTSSSEGTGLGLAISRDLVTAMGGTLDLQSEIGVGTTFFFTITLQKDLRDQSEVAA